MNRPNINIPTEFAINGTKTDFSQAKITNGFDRLQPDVLPGDNLNKFIDDTYKGLNGVLELYEGCVLYDSTVAYNNTSIVFYINSDDNKVEVYHSLINNNLNNPLSDTTAWEKVEMGGGGTRNIGEIVASTLPLTDAGLHLLDGALINGDGIYSDFVDYIANIYDASANYFCTEVEWQTSVNTYGVCGKFVYDSTNNTVRLPKITGILEGTTDANALGNLIEAGLPNISGVVTTASGAVMSSYETGTGAFTNTSVTRMANWAAGSTSGNWGGAARQDINFSASNSNSVYGNSNTVQPQTIKCYYYIVIATSAKTDIHVDIDEIATDLNSKADVDLSNCTKPYIVETYVNGTSWYRVYSDGWIEQGGSVPQNSGTSGTITFLKSFENTNYTITSNCGNNANNTHVFIVNTYDGKTTSNISWYKSASSLRGDWQACGY